MMNNRSATIALYALLLVASDRGAAVLVSAYS